MENEDIWQGLTAFGVIDFYTSAPSIDVSMFNFITENTEAEVEITAPITDETSEIAREITIEVIDSELILKDKWAEAKTTLPLVIKESKLYAGQDDILYPISLLPGEIKAGLEVPLLKVDLEYDENQAPVYKVHSEEKTKLIFVPVELTREITIDPASGEVRNVKQPWWGALVSKSIIPVKVVPLPAPPQPVTPIVNPCPCPKLTEYKIRWDYMCLDYTKLTRNTIRVFVIPPAGDVRESCSYQWQIDWGDGNRDAAGIRFPPYAGNYDDPYYTVYAHGYKGIGNYQVTVKLFNKCDERTKTFKIPIGRPECNELVDKSLKDVNFDKQQFVDKADQLDESSLFDFINHQVNPLCSNLPGKTVTAMHYGTEGKICHVLVSITTKGIDPLKMKTRPEEHISELIRFHTLPSIFKASNRIYKKTDKDGRQAAYYEQGKNSAKIVYTPGEEPFFSLVMVFRSDCNCREEDMRYRIISNLTQVAEKKATKEAKENLKSDSTAPVKHYSKRVVDVLLEIGVCCPPGECK